MMQLAYNEILNDSYLTNYVTKIVYEYSQMLITTL